MVYSIALQVFQLAQGFFKLPHPLCDGWQREQIHTRHGTLSLLIRRFRETCKTWELILLFSWVALGLAMLVPYLLLDPWHC